MALNALFGLDSGLVATEDLSPFELDAGGIELPLNWTREVLSCL